MMLPGSCQDCVILAPCKQKAYFMAHVLAECCTDFISVTAYSCMVMLKRDITILNSLPVSISGNTTDHAAGPSYSIILFLFQLNTRRLDVFTLDDDTCAMTDTFLNRSALRMRMNDDD